MTILRRRAAFAVPLLVLLLGPPAQAGTRVTDCTAQQTHSALVSFAAAFNAADYRRLDTLFAGRRWFHWYSSSDPGRRTDPQARRRDTLLTYFRSRHARRDRIRLVSFTFNGNTLGYGNFVWRLRRSAGDFRGGAWFTADAKGAALCDGTSTTFVVLSIGGPAS